LTDSDVADLAFRIKGGDTPRVVVRTGSASVPVGTRGNVIRIGKPSEGEYIVVRLGRDEVPFAPSELSLPNRGRSAAAAPAPAATKRTAAASSRSTTTKSASTTSTAAKSTSTKSAPTKSAVSKTSRPAAAKKQAPRAAPERTAAAATTRPKKTARRSSKRAPQPLTVTLRFPDSRWSVEAQRGSRRLARAMPLRPGAVSAFAEHVDEPAVREALVETVESCRAVVEQKAAALRAELEAAEASLKEYDARHR